MRTTFTAILLTVCLALPACDGGTNDAATAEPQAAIQPVADSPAEAAAPSAPAAPTAQLAVDGEARLAIVVTDGADARVRAAAETLADYLGRITGASFNVETGDGAAGIVVGQAGDFTALPFEIAFDEGPLHREDYLLRSTDGGLYLIGATPLAVEHAVWDVLHRIGYRQFFPGPTWEVVPSEPSVALSVDTLEQPDFYARRIWYNWGLWGYNNEPYRQWSARNRVVQGFRLNSGHAYDAIIAANRATFNEHPEYLALVNGKRGGTKFCVSNDDLRKLIVDHAVAQVKKNPDVDSISMDPSDGGGWCECEPCAEMGSVSDRALTLANEVAAAINDLGLGDKYVGMYAYNEHCPPPTIDVHPNVIISATTAFLRGGFTLDQVITGWQAAGATMGIYDYFSVIAWDWNMPRRAKASNPPAVAGSIRSFHEKGARFFDAESGDCWGPCGLGYYVAGRVLWDVDEADSVDAITEDFLTRAFGPTKEPMRRFYTLITTDRTRRSAADLHGRMYRALDEARQLAVDDQAVRQRIDDLVLYTRYAEMYDAYAGAVGDNKQTLRDAMITHAYRMRKTMMVHVYGLFARTVGQGAAAQADFPLKDETPFDDAEIRSIIENGIANNDIVELDFETVAFSDELIPAAEALGFADAPAGSVPTVPQDRHTYYVWVDEAPSTIHMKVTVQKVWANRPHEIKLYSPKDVTIGVVDESGIVQPDGQTYDVMLETPHDGLHRIETRDGGDYTRIAWPEDMPVTLPGGLDQPGVFNHFRGAWTMYFYVPKGTKHVAGWAQRIANWAPRISGTLKDADGNVHLDFAELDDGWFRVEVPQGQDGRVWKFENTQGVRRLVTVPPYFATTPQKLLLPREVVETDQP